MRSYGLIFAVVLASAHLSVCAQSDGVNVLAENDAAEAASDNAEAATMIAACEGKTAGVPCSFTNAQGAPVSGVCDGPAGGNAEGAPLECLGAGHGKRHR